MPDSAPVGQAKNMNAPFPLKNRDVPAAGSSSAPAAPASRGETAFAPAPPKIHAPESLPPTLDVSTSSSLKNPDVSPAPIAANTLEAPTSMVKEALAPAPLQPDIIAPEALTAPVEIAPNLRSNPGVSVSSANTAAPASLESEWISQTPSEDADRPVEILPPPWQTLSNIKSEAEAIAAINLAKQSGDRTGQRLKWMRSSQEPVIAIASFDSLITAVFGEQSADFDAGELFTVAKEKLLASQVFGLESARTPTPLSLQLEGMWIEFLPTANVPESETQERLNSVRPRLGLAVSFNMSTTLSLGSFSINRVYLTFGDFTSDLHPRDAEAPTAH